MIMDLRIIICRMRGVISLLSAISFFTVGMSSCQADENMQPSPDREATIYLNFKTSAITRTPMTRTVNEDDIQTVDLLAFKTGDTPDDIRQGTFFYRARGEYNPANRSVKVRLISDPHAQTLVLVANARDKVNRLAPALGEAKEEVMKRLLVSATPDGQPDLSNGYMPMWGELPNQTIDANYGNGTSSTAPKTTVTMIRPVAKVTLKCSNVLGKAFFGKFDALRLYNYRSKGRISPDNCTAPNTPGMTVHTPTVPDNATMAQGTYKELHRLGDPEIFAGGEKSFYLFEADNRIKADESRMKATCLIVHVKFNDNTPEGQALENSIHPHHGYYRIDFRDHATNRFFDLLRNHHYVIEIQSVDNPPAATPEEAFKGQYTLKCKIVPWNEVQEEVRVPVNKRLTVDKRSIQLSRALTKTLTVTTENTGGWTITDIPSWLTVSPTTSPTDGTQNITIKSKSSDGFLNTGSFKLKAGNTEMVIRVKLGKLPLEYVAEYNLAGGFLYGTKPDYSNPSLVTFPQTDPQLRWAINHTNYQSGYYNWYICKGIYDAAYNPSTKKLFSDAFFTTGEGKGYHLPSITEWNGVFSYNGQVKFNTTAFIQPINEAVEFGGIKKTYLNHYKCLGAKVCYCLRFGQGTGNPTGNYSVTEFPKATDNSMLCAYRYTLVGSFTNNSNNSHLKVECVYLGNSFTGDIDTISNDSWWNARTYETVTRIFPVAGYIALAKPSGSGTLNHHGYFGCYWSGTENGSSGVWNANFNSSNAGANSAGDRHNGFPVRLFADE